MKISHRLIIAVILCCLCCTAWSQRMIYQKEDSLKVMDLLLHAPAMSTTAEYMSHYGHQLVGTPYVAKTLEIGDKENLIINLRQLDCTTFTETVLALSLCSSNNKKTFLDYANYLRLIRYQQGHISYDKRLHYFSSWIDDNSRQEFVREITNEVTLPKAKRGMGSRGFMTTHPTLYPQLASDTTMVAKIRQMEDTLTQRIFIYIPKSHLTKYNTLKKFIHDGDIIAIVTSKAGLDTSHIGIASWHKDGTLHLLNASQIHKRVIDEPMALYTYMQKHTSQVGIRVIGVKSEK